MGNLEGKEESAPAAGSPAEGPRPSQAPAPSQPKRRRPKPIGILLVCAVALAGAWAWWHFSHLGKESTDDAQIEADVVPLAPEVGGRVAAVEVRDNQHVRAGAILVELADAQYQARLAEAQAAFDSAQQNVLAAQALAESAAAQAKGGFSSSSAAVTRAQADLAGAQAAVTAAQAAVGQAAAIERRARSDYRRALSLFRARAIPRAQLDAARASADATSAAEARARALEVRARQSETAARENVARLQGELGAVAPVEARIAAANATARLARDAATAAKARLALAKLALEQTRLVAPVAGVVSHLTARAGALVEPGQTVAELVPDSVYVVANFKETQLDHMRVGQRADVSVDAYPGHALPARVESFSGGTGARFSLLPPENATGNFVKIVQRVPVRLEFARLPPQLPRLRAGMSVEVTVHVGGTPTARRERNRTPGAKPGLKP